MAEHFSRPAHRWREAGAAVPELKSCQRHLAQRHVPTLPNASGLCASLFLSLSRIRLMAESLSPLRALCGMLIRCPWGRAERAQLLFWDVALHWPVFVCRLSVVLQHGCLLVLVFLYYLSRLSYFSSHNVAGTPSARYSAGQGCLAYAENRQGQEIMTALFHFQRAAPSENCVVSGLGRKFSLVAVYWYGVPALVSLD